MLRQAVFGRLAGYEDVNDAERLAHDPTMRWIVGGKAPERGAASSSQMGRFETEVLTQEANLMALADLSGCWIDAVHARRPVKGMDGSPFQLAVNARVISGHAPAEVAEAEVAEQVA